MDNATISLIILGCVVALFIWNRLPVGIVAVLTALSLYVTGVLTINQALGGFGDPVVTFLASLFVVSEGLDSAGVTGWAGDALAHRVGTGRVRLTVAILGLCALLSALITANGAVAALLPMVIILAVRVRQPPSRLLIPFAFAGAAGALLALTGSPVNVIVSQTAHQTGAGNFGYFSFAIVGIPLLIGTITICVLLGPRLLPVRAPDSATQDLSGYADMLADHYDLDQGFYSLRVRSSSPLIGVPIDRIDLHDRPGLDIVDLDRPDPLVADDVLVVTGPSREVSRLAVDNKLAIAMRPVTSGANLVTGELGVAEVVIPPRSSIIGDTVFPGALRGPDLVILAVRRLGHERGPVVSRLAEGDSLLVHGAWPAIQKLVDDRDVLVVDSPDAIRRQVAPPDARAWRAVGVLVAMVGLLASGIAPPSIPALGAAIAMVLLNVVSERQAIRSIPWETIILIGGLIPLSQAIESSGAAKQIAGILVDVVGNGRPYLLMIALFVLAAALGQIVSNTATTLIVAPIVVVAAGSAGVSPLPLLMTIAVAGSASFLTPIATPTNMMVMTPGGYRFGDYWKLGLVLMGYWLLIALVVIPLVWKF